MTPEEIAAKEEQDRLAAAAAAATLTDEEMIAKMVADKVEEQLKTIKTNLDKAYEARNAAEAKAAEFERKEREAQLAALEAEGKHKEAYEIRLAAQEAELATLRNQNTAMSRDGAVNDALKGLDFRNVKASEMAFAEIVNQLVKNEEGKWVHRSGVPITDFVSAYAKLEDNAFLFKVKGSSGNGSQQSAGTPAGGSGETSLFKKSQAEVLKMAAEGKFGHKQNY
jgi:hypothetical protein